MTYNEYGHSEIKKQIIKKRLQVQLWVLVCILAVVICVTYVVDQQQTARKLPNVCELESVECSNELK